MKRTCIALLLAALGCAGCCGTGGKCWNASEAAVIGEPAQPSEQNAWRTFWFEDQPAHLVPERVEGGIY